MATQVTTGLLANDAVTDAKLSDTITATTQSASDNTTKVATTAYVTTAIANLADSAPSTLNTLNELAAALGDDANFSTTVTNSIATKLPLAGGTLTGALTTNGVINTGTSHNFAINTPNSVRINIDSNDSATDQVFVIGKNQTGVDASNDVLFKVGEDGKVGIGTGAPGNVLHVHQTDAGSNSYVHITQADGGSANTDGLSIGIEDGGVNAVIRNRESGYLRMYTNNLERARIHANGKASFSANGIGDVTSVPRDFAFYTEGSTNGMEIRSNDQRLLFFGAGGSGGTGSDDGYLAMSSQGTGKIALNANGVSYINGGNFGIGTSSPSYPLHLSGTIGDQVPLLLGTVTGTPSAGFNWVAEYMAANLPQDKRIVIALGKARGTNNSATISYVQRSDSNDNAIAFGHFGANDLVNFTYEGKVGIGTTTPENALHTLGSITIEDQQQSSTGNAWTYYKNADRTWLTGIRGSLSDVYSIYDLTADAQRFQISSNGSIGAPTGSNIYNASDERLKQNISSLDSSLDIIKNLNPVKFNWIDNFSESENGKTLYGFVAQEVQDVFPDAIEHFSDGKPVTVDDKVIENPLTVREKFLVPMLVKAVQEQQDIIDDLKARIETLEE